MAQFAFGELVKVTMPQGRNKRGVVGISVLYSTSPEARFDGATGEITGINPRGPLGIHLYLVNFRDRENKVAIPWQAQWFREEWLAPTGEPRPAPAPGTGVTGEFAAATGQGMTSTGESS